MLFCSFASHNYLKILSLDLKKTVKVSTLRGIKKYNNLTDAVSGLDRKAADMTALVLISQKIEVLWQEHNGVIDLIIDDADNARAWDTLSRFYTENNIPSEESEEMDTALYDHIKSDPTLPAINEKGKIAAAGACLMLCIIHAATVYHGNHHQVVLNHGASALYILQGEYERSITALMLHSDLSHLAGNVMGLLVLGSVICSLLGPGRGLFLILFSGAVGNLLNAFMYRRIHLSIGASTAVMGAVGILVAWQLKKKVIITLKPDHHIDIKGSALYPLGAGAALVGMFSGGENTDVSAHVFGFMAGLGGAIFFFWTAAYFKQKAVWMGEKIFLHYVDNLFLVIVAAIILLAWIRV
jgi:membrane associated rhomboid family serine protease